MPEMWGLILSLVEPATNYIMAWDRSVLNLKDI